MSIQQTYKKGASLDQEEELFHQELTKKIKSEQNNSVHSLVKRKPQDKSISFSSKIFQIHQQSGSNLSTSISSFSSLCTQKLLPLACVLQIPYSPRDTKEYFLCNDVFIEFDLDATSEQAFKRYKNLQNTLRPISCIKHLKESGFLILQFDETKRGISDFSFIIHQLKSLQNSALFQLSQSLELYVSLMNISRSLDAQLSPEEQLIRKINNKEQLQTFIQEGMPNILNELNKDKFMIFLLYDMTEGYHDQTRKLYGMNEKYIQLFGSSVEHLTSLQFKQGWFNQTQFADRNRQSIEYFSNIQALYESRFDLSKIQMESDYQMVTLDGIEVPVRLKPTPFYCYSSTYKDPLIQSQQLLIGILHLMEIELTADSKRIIRQARSNRCGMMNSGGKDWDYGGSIDLIQKKQKKEINKVDCQNNLRKEKGLVREKNDSKDNKNEVVFSSSSWSSSSPLFSGSFNQINEQQEQESRHRQCSFKESDQIPNKLRILNEK